MTMVSHILPEIERAAGNLKKLASTEKEFITDRLLGTLADLRKQAREAAQPELEETLAGAIDRVVDTIELLSSYSDKLLAAMLLEAADVIRFATLDETDIRAFRHVPLSQNASVAS